MVEVCHKWQDVDSFQAISMGDAGTRLIVIHAGYLQDDFGCSHRVNTDLEKGSHLVLFLALHSALRSMPAVRLSIVSLNDFLSYEIKSIS